MSRTLNRNQRIGFYDNLNQLLDAGLGFSESLQQSSERMPERFKKSVIRVSSEITEEENLIEKLTSDPSLFPRLDGVLVRAGYHSGSLPEVLQALSHRYRLEGSLRKTIMAGLAYPFFVLHLAAFLLPFPEYFLGVIKFTDYAIQVGCFLLIFYAPYLTLKMLAAYAEDKPFLKNHLDKLKYHSPFLGKAIRDMELCRYCFTFKILYQAGIPMDQCCKMSLEGCDNTALIHLLEGGTGAVNRGEPVHIGYSERLPELFLTMWETGENSGKLDQSLEKLSNYLKDDAEFRWRQISIWIPRLMYLGVIVIVASKVIKFFIDYVNQLESYMPYQ